MWLCLYQCANISRFHSKVPYSIISDVSTGTKLYRTIGRTILVLLTLTCWKETLDKASRVININNMDVAEETNCN